MTAFFTAKGLTGLTYKGLWSNATAYVVGDVVSLSDAEYVCATANTNQTPTANPTYWDAGLFSRSGSGGGGSSSDFPYNVVAYGAVGDGTTVDTVPIQAAINAAAARYSTTGSSSIVLFPSGKRFLTSRLSIAPGVTLWAYGATIQAQATGSAPAWGSGGFIVWLPGGVHPTNGSALTDFHILGGTWVGTGFETAATNQFGVNIYDQTSFQDSSIRDTTWTGWGMAPIKLSNPNNSRISDNKMSGNFLAGNSLNQNTLNIFINDTAPFTGKFMTSRNRIHNSGAEAIGVVVGLLSGNGPSPCRLDWICDGNIITCDPPRVDQNGVGGATVTITSGSSTVTDTACVSGDLNKCISGTGIQNVTYITAVTPGVSFTMSKTANSTPATSIVNVGVQRSSISLEIDNMPSGIPVTDFTVVNNDLLGSERNVLGIHLPGGHTVLRGLWANNRVQNIQVGGAASPQGDGISVQRDGTTGSPADVTIVNNRIDAPHPIQVTGTNFTNAGLQSGNRFSTDVIQGQAVLVAGSVTVTTAEIRTGDNVVLSRVVTGGTVGSLSVGTITDSTSFTITSSSGTDTSTIYWKIDH